jgi:hypothetical protein
MDPSEPPEKHIAVVGLCTRHNLCIAKRRKHFFTVSPWLNSVIVDICLPTPYTRHFFTTNTKPMCIHGTQLQSYAYCIGYQSLLDCAQCLYP